MRAFWTGWAIHNCHPCWEAKGSNTALTMPLFYDGLVTPNKEYSVCAVGDSQCQNLSRKTMVNLAAAVATKQTTQTFAKPNPSPCQVDPGTKLALLSCGTMPSWYAMALGLPVGLLCGAGHPYEIQNLLSSLSYVSLKLVSGLMFQWGPAW